MKQHREVNAAIARALDAERCIVGTDDALRRALKRRSQSGEMVSPYPNVYCPTERWLTLTSCERSLHIARALAKLHPSWSFAGLTAADAHGFDHSWQLHANHRIWLANPTCRTWPVKPRPPAPADTRQWSLFHVPAHDAMKTTASALPVTGRERTLIDCGLRLGFHEALPIFDAAARQGVDVSRTLTFGARMHADMAPIANLARYADPRSENGGESAVRARIITFGFALPELQVEFRDPNYPAKCYRADFVWRLHDGRIIVLEYDGMTKYEDPSMTRGRTAQALLNERNERDRILKAAGVTTILHCTYDEAIVRNTMYHRLREAGVPLVERHMEG